MGQQTIPWGAGGRQTIPGGDGGQQTRESLNHPHHPAKSHIIFGIWQELLAPGNNNPHNGIPNSVKINPENL